MANTYKNIVITPNTGSTTGDPTIVFSGGDSNTNTDIILRVYPTSNGTLSFEGNAGQLFSITNDLSNTIFSVNDVSGIPLLEINVASQQITLGQFYGNVGIGTNASNVNNYKLDVIGGANISLPNLTVGGTNVSAAIAAANANAATLSANVNVLAAAVVANDASQGANIAVLAAAFVANSQTLSANVNTLAATFASANANNISLSANVNTLAAALVLANTSSHADIDALSIVANAKVSSVTGTSGRITSSGGTTPAIDLATAGAGAATYSSGISAVTVDAYGRVTSVTGSANYVVSGGALGTPSSGTLTNCTFPTLNQNTTGSAAKLASQGQYANSAPGNTRGSTGLNLYEVYSNGYPTTYGNILHMYGAGAGQLLIGWSGVDGQTTDNFIRSKRDNDTGAWSSWAKIITDQNITSYGYVTSSGVTSITAGTGLSGGTITSTGTISLPSTGPGAGSYSSGISALTIDAQGRITAITGSAGYLTSSTGLANTSGVSFNGNLFFPTGNVGIGTATSSYKLSVNGTAYFGGKITSGIGGGGSDALDFSLNDAYASFRVIRNNGGLFNDGMYIGFGNAGTGTTKIYGGGAVSAALEKFSDYTLEPGSFRSPIFYDSNNTAYYVDPAGLTNIDRMQINSANTGVVLSVGDSGLDNGSTYGMVNLTRAADTVRPHLAFIRSGSYVWQTGYLSGTNSLGFFPWNFSGSQGTPALYMTTGSIVYAPTEFRTPIIYDNNNTAYYFDGAGTSVMNRIQFDQSNVAAPTTNQAVGSRLTLYPTGGTGHYSIGIEGSHMWFNTFSGYKWYVNETNWATLNADYFQHNSDIRAPIFYDSNDTNSYWDGGTMVLRDASPTIFLRDTDHNSAALHCNSNLFYILRGGNDTTSMTQVNGVWPFYINLTNNDATFGGSVYAPIYHDSNNTAYYVDPASTSILNKVTLSNGSSGVLNGLDDYHQIILRGYPSNATTGITATDVTSFSEYGGDFRFYRKNGSSLDLLTEINTDYLSHYSDIRTPIFYDSNNTGYYLDPASTSVFNAISMYGHITGRTDTAANTSVANDTGSMSIRGSTTAPATVSFHRAGAYAINMGLDTDNIFRIGGWSDGVNTYRMQLGTPGGTHTFNGTVSATTFSGAGTSLTGTASSLTVGNATTATNWGAYGAVPAAGSSGGTPSTIPRSDVNGYTYFGYINSSTSNSENPAVSQVIVTNGSDNFYRKSAIANFTTYLTGTASGLTAGSVSGGTVSATTGSFSSDLSFNSGYGSAAVAYGCRVWIRFITSLGTPSISNDGNVSTITDNGVGNFVINFTTALVDANYAAVANYSETNSATGGGNDGQASCHTYATGSVRIYCARGDGSALDPARCSLIVCR